MKNEKWGINGRCRAVQTDPERLGVKRSGSVVSFLIEQRQPGGDKESGRAEFILETSCETCYNNIDLMFSGAEDA